MAFLVRFHRHMSDYTFFWHSGSPFSNWYASKYVYRGITFTCTEQGIMYEKALLFDPEGEEYMKILTTTNPRELKKLGRCVKNFDESVWAKKREELVYPHLVAKFIQNRELYKKLMATGNTLLVEASPFDCIWGIGFREENALTVPVSKWGLNILGKLLTRIRNDFRMDEKFFS